MDADDSKPRKFLKLKNFLSRNPAVNPRTFSRWKKQGLIDYLQPGGPNTQILVPEDALERMQQRKRNSQEELDKPSGSPKLSGRKVAWKKKLPT